MLFNGLSPDLSNLMLIALQTPALLARQARRLDRDPVQDSTKLTLQRGIASDRVMCLRDDDIPLRAPCEMIT
jgi:hypothetical protein